MSKLNSKSDVIERYWPDYIDFCMRSLDSKMSEFHVLPTEDGFWKWYITKGPMGVKHACLYYNEERVEYV